MTYYCLRWQTVPIIHYPICEKMKSDEVFDPYGIPKEIYMPPLPLIGITGLNIHENKSHSAAWQALTLNRRSDRIPLRFVIIDENEEFPTVKQKRQSYEWYIPKGILKSNWVDKYLNKIPSLLVLFWDLDWNQPTWLNEKNKIAAAIQKIKISLSGRNTRIAVVLLQCPSSPPPVPGEEGNGASEKAAALCAACDLPPKHLFVLPHTDSHLLGYTIRLENALSEIAFGFYIGEIKGIKAHRDLLNKTNHQLLFIRHQFKIAFHNEMRNDPQTAIKHYGQCYHYLLELRFTNTNLQEIRTAAGIVNYKLCKLDFILNLPRDAIEQFKKHIEVFHQRTGPKELIFEHYAWLSKQHQIFGEVFEEAVREGLPAVQTQHPGIYYKQAAQYAVLRRNTAIQVCKNVVHPEGNLLDGWESLEFYGQRPWRPGKHSLEPPEKNTEMEGIKAFCYYELNKVDHSSLILPQFTAAIAQFKNYRCPRIKRYLMFQMAKEYHYSKNPSKALTLLSHVMWDDRIEKWWTLLSSCSFLALSCAYQMASVQDYMSFCLEILGPRVIASPEEKAAAFTNLLKIINHEIPDPPFDLSEDTLEMASELWSVNLLSSKTSIVINMNDILPCLEVRCGFTDTASCVDKAVGVLIRIKSHLNESLQCSSLTLHTDSSTNAHLTEADPSKLCLSPSAITEIHLSYNPAIQDVDKLVNISGITLGLGSSAEKPITLHWTGTGKDGVTVYTGGNITPKEFGCLPADPFESAELHPEIKVASRTPKLEAHIVYDESALVWEWLPVSIKLCNNELSTISQVSVSLNLEKGSESSLERTTQISTTSNLESKLISSSISNHPLSNVDAADSIQCIFYIKALTSAKRNFCLKISYKCAIDVEGKDVVCPTFYIQSFSVTSKFPFQITIETLSVQFCPLTRVARNERFLVVPQIKCCSHVPIILSNSAIGLASHATPEGENLSQVAGVELTDGEEATDCFCLSVGSEAPFGSPLSLGQYLLYWSRVGENSSPVSVSIGLPSITVEDWGIWVDVDLPPQGTVRVPLTVAYEVSNTSDRVQALTVSMDFSDAFMFSGHKEIRLRLLPGWHECITYTLYPLLAGNVQLPRLHFALEGSNTSTNCINFDDFILRILPSHLFIMPREKPIANEQQIEE